MTTDTQDTNGDRLVTASEIADIAGVKPSAVSNWRKRFTNFPGAAGTAPSGGDLFRLDDVERWLRSRRQSRKPQAGAVQQLWSVAERLRGRALAGDVAGIVAIGAAFIQIARTSDGFPATWLQASPDEVRQSVTAAIERIEAEQPELAGVFAPLREVEPEPLRLLLDTLDDIDARERLASAVDEILARVSRYGDFRTPTRITDLLIELAAPHGAVFDPAAGSGEFLLRASQANPRTSLYGQELNMNTWRIAMARLLLHDVDAELACADSFTGDAFPELRADVILSEPPAGGRLTEARELAGDPRWQVLGLFDSPSPRASEFAWLAHVIYHLAPEGRGYVLLPMGSLLRGGADARLRSELVRQGAVETIISLPSGGLQDTNAPSALWVVRQPTPNPDQVLLVDADAQPGAMEDELRESILETVHAWRTRPEDFSPTAGFATSVPVLELLAGDASLVPSRWLYEPKLLDTSALISAVQEAQRALDAARTGMPQTPPEFELHPSAEPPPRVRVRDLVQQNRAKIIRPARLKKDDYTDEGLPVWLPSDVRAPWEREDSPRFADPEDVDPRSITAPGDIVLTTVGGLRTRVDFEGGHVLGTSLQALRLEPGTGDPQVVAALLTSDANRNVIRGMIPRVNVPELEIPLLKLADAAGVRNVLDALERELDAASEIARRAAQVRDALIGALATGTATVDPRDGND